MFCDLNYLDCAINYTVSIPQIQIEIRTYVHELNNGSYQQLFETGEHCLYTLLI